jgi:hypothetical protein
MRASAFRLNWAVPLERAFGSPLSSNPIAHNALS